MEIIGISKHTEIHLSCHLISSWLLLWLGTGEEWRQMQEERWNTYISRSLVMDLMGISARHRASRFMEFKYGHRVVSEGDFWVHMHPSLCRKRLKAKRRDPACQPRRDSVTQPWHLLFWVQEMLSQKKMWQIFLFFFHTGIWELELPGRQSKERVGHPKWLAKACLARSSASHGPSRLLLSQAESETKIPSLGCEDGGKWARTWEQAVKDLPSSFRTHTYLENVNYPPEPQFPHMWDGFEEPTR